MADGKTASGAGRYSSWRYAGTSVVAAARWCRCAGQNQPSISSRVMCFSSFMRVGRAAVPARVINAPMRDIYPKRRFFADDVACHAGDHIAPLMHRIVAKAVGRWCGSSRLSHPRNSLFSGDLAGNSRLRNVAAEGQPFSHSYRHYLCGAVPPQSPEL